MSLGSIPAATIASDPAAPVLLPGTTLTAVTADIDDDGAREVVRIVAASNSMAIEVWDLVAGTWTATLSADMQPFVPSGIRVTEGIVPIALTRARVAGVERVLLLGAGYDQDRGTPECCFTVHELVDLGHGPDIRALAVPDSQAESVTVIDLDGDGTDELAASLVRWDEAGSAASTDVEVLRREGNAFTSIAAWQDDGPWWVMLPGETDGLPGHELLASGEEGQVLRLSWVGGALLEEHSSLRLDGEQAWVNGAVDGALIVAMPGAVALAQWPSGGDPVITASHETRDYPTIGMLGTGRDGLFVVQDHDGSGSPGSSFLVLDARLELIGEVTISRDAQALWELLERMSSGGGGWASPRNIWPYVGPADGDWTGEGRSYVIGGMQVTGGPDGTFESRPTRMLVNRPIGTAGPNGAWVALTDGYFGGGPVAYLGQGWYEVESRLILAPAAALLEPVEQELAISVGFEGAIETGGTAEAISLLAAPTGAEIVVTVPQGTVALSSDGSQMTDHGTRDATVRLSVTPPRRPPRDRPAEFVRELLLIGPEGNVSFHRWEGTFAPEAPELTAWTQAEPLSLEATVAGRAGFGSTVTVDGREVPLNDHGGYRATVDAPPWPRTVVVVARDPFGGEQRATVQIIGLVDYRGLPWAPIAGIATLLGGAVLFLRTPRHRPLAERPVLDDGQLEDLDGDVI